jgi:hypothetical protein
MVIGDLVAVKGSFLSAVGFTWQVILLGAAPILCAVGCIILFLRVPVGSQSRHTLIRGIGRISVLGRYWVYVGIAAVATAILYLVLLSFVRSIQVSGEIPAESISRLVQELRHEIAIDSNHDRTRVLFLEDNRTAVKRALQKEGIAIAE